MPGFQRYIVCRVVGGITVFVGIYSKQREVCRVSRPFPVVRIATEFAHRLRRSTDHTHVAVGGVHKQQELVAIEDIYHLRIVDSSFRRLIGNNLTYLVDNVLAFALGHIVV